jgi:glycosyltransferase involved in cell wall biosynthesis
MMKPHLTVSCVIPVFNGERFLAEAIESVLAQSYETSEIIVVDDGSTDGTKTVAARFDQRVAYVEQSNAGPASARNHGIQRASGDFIAFLDSDDLWHPEKTAIQLAHFAARAELVLCTAQMQNFWSAQLAHEAASLADTRLTEIQPNVGSTLMARRSLFQTIGLLDPEFKHRDIQELMLRATHRGLAIEALPDVLVQRRIHDANLSRNRSEAGDLELLALARTRMLRRRKSQT